MWAWLRRLLWRSRTIEQRDDRVDAVMHDAEEVVWESRRRRAEAARAREEMQRLAEAETSLLRRIRDAHK